MNDRFKESYQSSGDEVTEEEEEKEMMTEDQKNASQERKETIEFGKKQGKEEGYKEGKTKEFLRNIEEESRDRKIFDLIEKQGIKKGDFVEVEVFDKQRGDKMEVLLITGIKTGKFHIMYFETIDGMTCSHFFNEIEDLHKVKKPEKWPNKLSRLVRDVGRG